MASFIYTPFTKHILKGDINLSTDTIRVALLGSGYTPTKTHDSYADVSGQEVTGTGYTAKGAALANKTITEDDTNFYTVFDADDPSWASSSIIARYGAIYKDSGTANTSYLVALIDFGQLISSSGSTFSIALNASGILRLTVS